MKTFDITTEAIQADTQDIIVICREYTAKDKKEALQGFKDYIKSNKQLTFIDSAKIHINLLNENKQ